MSDDTVLYQFKSEAKHQGRDISEIAVRAPRMRDLKAMESIKGSASKLAKTIEVLTGLTAREIDELHFNDVQGLGEVIGKLFGAPGTPSA